MIIVEFNPTTRKRVTTLKRRAENSHEMDSQGHRNESADILFVDAIPDVCYYSGL